MSLSIIEGEEGIQGSEAWKSLRNRSITASDLPVILGESPYCDPLTLWQRKVGFAAPQESLPHMQRGVDLEPMVRDMVNRDMGANFKPVVVKNSNRSWCIASLDGYDEATDTILEIKCGSKASHKEAEQGNVPAKYKPQLQWQMFCSGCKKCFYVSYSEGEYVLIEVSYDSDFIENVAIPAARGFHSCVLNMREPETEECNIVHIDDEEFLSIVPQWDEANKMRTFYEEQEKSLKEKLVEFTDDGDCRGGGIIIKRVQRNGSIEWEKLWAAVKEEYPCIAIFNPEEYRKQQIGYWKITREKE